MNLHSLVWITLAILFGVCIGLVMSGRTPSHDAVLSRPTSLGDERSDAGPNKNFALVKTLQLPCGEVTIKSEFATAFPLFDANVYSKSSASERASIAKNVLDTLADAEKRGWKLRAIAEQDGPFEVTTIVAAALYRYFSRAIPSGFPKDLILPSRFDRPITIKVFRSTRNLLEASPTWTEGEMKNGYFDPAANEIGIVLDPTLLDYEYPPNEGASAHGELANQAFDALRRTVVVPLFHELTHALAQASRNPLYLSPLFAEGLAVYEASRLEREEMLMPLIARQFLENRSLEVVNNVRTVRQGDVLTPAEYGRLCRMRQVLQIADGNVLATALTASSIDFQKSPRNHASVQGCDVSAQGPQSNYDLGWLVVQFVQTQHDGEQILSDLVGIALRLDAHDQTSKLAGLEKRLRAFCLRSGARTMSLEEYGKALANAVKIQDRAAQAGHFFDGYRAFVPVLQADPALPLALSYLGDIFWQVDQRDLFFYYYDQALRKEPQKGTPKMGGRLRLVSRYIEGLWSLGRYQDAADLISRNVVTSLDIHALMRISLRGKFVEEANRIGWQPEKMRRLEREHELGEKILAYSMMSSERLSRDLDAEVAERSNAREAQEVAALKAFVDTVRRRMLQEIKLLLPELGYTSPPKKAWFLLDYQMEGNQIDLSALLDDKASANAAPPSDLRQDSGDCQFSALAWYDTFLCNKGLRKAIEEFKLGKSSDSQIVGLYQDALRADVLLFSGLQVLRALQWLASGGVARRSEALAILALSGDRQSLTSLARLNISAWSVEERQLLKRTTSFLTAYGRDTTPLALENVKASEFKLTSLLSYPSGTNILEEDLRKVAPSEEVVLFLSRNRAVVRGGTLTNMALYMLLAHTSPEKMYGFWSDLLYKDGHYDAALDYAMAGLAAGGPSASLENEIGNILSGKRDLRGANEHYERSLKLGRNDGWPEVNMAANYSELGDLNAAEKWFRQALTKRATARSAEEYGGYLNDFAWFLASKRKNAPELLREGRRMSEEANRLVKYTNPQFLDTLAECQAALGDAALAVKTERRASELVSPGSPDSERYAKRVREFERLARQ